MNGCISTNLEVVPEVLGCTTVLRKMKMARALENALESTVPFIFGRALRCSHCREAVYMSS